MFRNEMLSTGRLYVDEMLNECLLNVFTVLLICSSMTRCGIRPPHTTKYSLLHAIEMYPIVFMVIKSLSKKKNIANYHSNAFYNVAKKWNSELYQYFVDWNVDEYLFSDRLVHYKSLININKYHAIYFCRSAPGTG